jgi:subtilisin family serine protease
MSFKLKRIVLCAALISSVFIYTPVQAKYTTYDVAPATSPVKFTYSLSTSIPFISANIPFDSQYRGQGIYTVIIDTGIEASHPFFQNRVALEACFAAVCPNGKNQQIGPGAAKPVHWHGTHVAGIVAGYNSSFHGVAPEANIIAINVFDATGAAYDDDIIRALNWVLSISNNYNIAAINMSLGGNTTYTTTCDDYMPSMTTAIENLRAKNIATVIAAGNNYANGMSAPACISSSVSVAAMYTGTGSITNFSNINKYTTIAAPGASINSSKTEASYGTASGTSMATPFVVGAFAVYRSKFGIQSVSKVVSDFKSTTKTAYDSYARITIPRLDFAHLFATDTPTTTTTAAPVTTTTVVPITTTTTPQVTTTTSSVVTTSTIPVTTTTIPVVTTTSVASTTTTTPPVVTTTIPRTSSKPVSTPILHEISGIYKTFVYIYYRHPYYNSQNVSYYTLKCNGSTEYTIPRNGSNGWDVYKLKVPAKNISYCAMRSVSYDGSTSSYTSNVNIYPKNKISSLTIKSIPKGK